MSTIYEPVIITKPDAVHIADTARIDSFCKIEGGSGVTIGEGVHIASFVHLNIGGGELVMEDYSAAASGARIVTGSNRIEGLSCSAVAPAEMQIVKRGKVVIGKYAVLFVNAVVLPGVTLGEGAALAAGGVATKDIPAWEIWGGIPARKIGERRVLAQLPTIDERLPDGWTLADRGSLGIDVIDHRGFTTLRLPANMSEELVISTVWENYAIKQAGGY